MIAQVKKIQSKEFETLFRDHRKDVFKDDFSYLVRGVLSEQELEKVFSLRINDTKKIHLAAFNDQSEFVGWSWGFQVDNFRYYMCNSAVLEPYRKKGIYTQLLKEHVHEAKNLGFQEVFSRHNASNNSVLIPKLKFGFVIKSLEIDDIFGALVILSYFTNPTRRKIFDMRTGQIKMDAELKEIFQI